MEIHKQSLEANAKDSFNEALNKYHEGLQPGRLSANKFAILHLSHALELLLKFYVSEQHALLIYKTPSSKDIAKSQTINMFEAMQILENTGYKFKQSFVEDVKWLKALRNNIEHYQFDMGITEARENIARIVHALYEVSATFDPNHILFELDLDQENWRLFEQLTGEYKKRVDLARDRAKTLAGEQATYSCGLCGTAGTALYRQDSVYCTFCNRTDRLLGCVICHAGVRESDAERRGSEDGDENYICIKCKDGIACEP